jgi:copper chaperone CopZ
MKTLLISMCTVFFMNCNGDIQKADINIPTAQCGMCAMTIEDALGNVDGVKKAQVDMEKLVATVAYDAEKTGVSNLESAISNSGYQANEKLANDEVYQTLPACCKLPKDR